MNILDDSAILKKQKSAELLVKNKITAIKKIKNITYLLIKRFFDIFCSIIGVFIMLPLAVIIKILYILSGDRKSIFYKQKRVGKNGKLIYMYKFRSMVGNADEILKELLKDEKYKKEWDLYQKFENDPRITKIGRFLRKTSLDEIPQFINILKGDMSLIGPRPLVVGELDAHNGDHSIYEKVRPGLTSWWASNGRSNVEYDERLNLEYFYVNNMSLWLDIKCIFKTILVVFQSKGAK